MVSKDRPVEGFSMGMHEFVWMLPCYAIASEYSLDPHTGEVVFDETLRFVAPVDESRTEQRVAIFTDSDLADEYIEYFGHVSDWVRLRINDPHYLASLLRLAQPLYPGVVIDCNPKTKRGRAMDFDELIPQLETWEGDRDDN